MLPNWFEDIKDGDRVYAISYTDYDWTTPVFDLAKDTIVSDSKEYKGHLYIDLYDDFVTWERSRFQVYNEDFEAVQCYSESDVSLILCPDVAVFNQILDYLATAEEEKGRKKADALRECKL